MLSGNHAHPMKNSAGKDDDEHVFVYTASRISAHEDISLTVGGLILIGLLRGGDYNPEGLPGCGPNVAHALAQCGFGDTLIEATRNLSKEHLPAFLTNWRHELRQELKTNSRGFLNTKKAKLAKDLPETFPDIDVLMLYTNPVTSESERKIAPINYHWEREPDLGKIAGVCEWFFEWGVKEIIVKRFRTVIWAPMVLRILRRAALEEDKRKEKPAGFQLSTPRKNGRSATLLTSPGTPSKMIAKNFSSLKLKDDDDEEEEEEHRLIQKIHSKRTHASTDGVLEYRLEIAPAQLVKMTEAGVEGRRQLVDGADISDGEGGDDDADSDGDGKKKKGVPKKPPPEPTSHVRIWMPACMVSIVEPELVEAFEEVEGRKAQKKADAAERKALNAQGIEMPKKSKAKTTAPTKNSKSISSKVASRDGEDSESEEDFGDVFGLVKCATKKGGPKKGSQLRRIVREEEEEETEQEVEDGEQEQRVGAPKTKASASTAPAPMKKVDSFFATRKPKLHVPSGKDKKKTTQSAPLKSTASQGRSSILLELSNSDRLATATSTKTSVTAMSTASSTSLKKTLTPFPLSFCDKEDSDLPARVMKASSSSTSITKSVRSYSISPSPSKRDRQRTNSSNNSDLDHAISNPHKSPRKKKTQTSPNRKATSSASVISTSSSKYKGDQSRKASQPHVALSSASMMPLQAARDRKMKKTTVVFSPIRQEEEESLYSDEENERPNSPSPLRPRSTKNVEGKHLQVTTFTLTTKSSPSFQKPTRSQLVIDISSEEDEGTTIRPPKLSGNTVVQRRLMKVPTADSKRHREAHVAGSLSGVEVIDLT